MNRNATYVVYQGTKDSDVRSQQPGQSQKILSRCLPADVNSDERAMHRSIVGEFIDPGPLTSRLMAEKDLPFRLTLATNEDPESLAVVAKSKPPFSSSHDATIFLNHRWPEGVISLPHVALPFPPDGPLYGSKPPSEGSIAFLGQLAIKGERDLLRIPYDWLLRLRHNPSYDFLEQRAIDWADTNDDH